MQADLSHWKYGYFTYVAVLYVAAKSKTLKWYNLIQVSVYIYATFFLS